MKSREATKDYRLSKWAGILRERAESGQSVRDYCTDIGIPEHQYYYWQRELREAACEQLMESRLTPTTLTPPGFVEVKTPLHSILSPTSSNSSQLCVEALGVKITAGGEYPVDKLVVLLREVMQP